MQLIKISNIFLLGMILNGLSNIITIIAGIFEGKSRRGDKKLPQIDLSTFNGRETAEYLQQREYRELGERDRTKLSVEGVGTNKHLLEINDIFCSPIIYISTYVQKYI